MKLFWDLPSILLVTQPEAKKISPAPSTIPSNYQGTTVNPESIITDGVQLHNPYKDMFFTNDQTLTFVRIPYEIVTFAFVDMQAVAIAVALSGCAKLPSKEKMQEKYDRTRRERVSVEPFQVLGFERELQYIRDVLDLIDGSSDQPRVVRYEKTRHYVEENQAEALREALRSSQILYGMDPAETEAIIAAKESSWN